jgi:hypothetical protein
MQIIAASFYGGIPLNPGWATAPIPPTPTSYDGVQPNGMDASQCKGGSVNTLLAMSRRTILAAAGGLALTMARRGYAATSAERKNGTMDIKRNGSRPSGKGPEAWFTGAVRVDPLFQVGDPTRVKRRSSDIRARCPHHVAHTSAGPDPDCHVRTRLGSMRGWTDRGSPPRRRYLVSTWREALAWRDEHDRFNTYSDYGVAQRQEC